MKQFIVLAAVVAVVAAGGAGDVDDALLARVAQILGGSSGGSSSSGGGFRGGSSGYSPPSNQYGAPPSNQYGAPGGGDFGRSGSSGVDIGRPEKAQRVAEFDLSSGGNDFRGGNSEYGAPAPPPSNSYGAPGGNFGRSSGSVDIGRPERAQRVAEFSLSGGSNGGGGRSGGY